MAHLNQKEAFEDFRERVFEGIKHHFPVEGRTQVLDLEGLELRGDPDPDNIRDQQKAKVAGESWQIPVYGTVVLKDKESGKVIDRKKVRMAELPGVTRRYSYVVGGQEWQVDNQWQLKPGVYVRRQQSGELEAQFNVPNKQAFDIIFDPAKKQLKMTRGKSTNIPLYPLMKVLGIDDDTLEQQWGKDVLAANKNARAVSTALSRFYKADKKRAPSSVEEAERYFAETMEQSQLRPESTELSLGRRTDKIDGDVFLRATSKMLRVHQGKEPEDDRDSLVYKDLRSTGDFAYDKLTDWRSVNSIKNKALRKINSASSVREVLKFDTFNEPIRRLFSDGGGLARIADQINPVEMVSSSMQTTIMGPGGIRSSRGVVDEAKLVNSSHLGFLDPIHTPESEKTGVTLHLPIGAKKKGREPVIPLYNMKTGKVEHVGPKEFLSSSVVLPDQVTWKNGKPVPIGKTVKMSKPGNEMGEGPASEAKYVLRHPSQLFDMTSNLIPFLGNNSGNRASYATHHIDQAISLRDRDAPLVQVGTGSNQPGFRTFEEFLGQRTAAHSAPMAGKVVSVEKDAIVLEGADGTRKEVQIYNNFPLNDQKAVLHSTPTVKVGDKVKAGQNVADTNFTKGGKLALGTNLNVAYIPYKGYNFEDGVVISESAAKKLSSEHMHKPVMAPDKDTIMDPKKFMIQHPESFTTSQYELLGADGVVKVGTRVTTGDPLIIGTRPYQLKDKTGARAIRKNASGAHTDVSLRWDSDHTGEVVGVHRNKKGEVTVHVRTVEPMQVGDKLCFDEQTEVLTSNGWKYVGTVTLEDKVCCLSEGFICYEKPVELHAYPTGGRMYRIKSQQVDLLVTEGHKMLVKKRGSTGFELLRAQDISGKRVRYKKDGVWQGIKEEEKIFPAIRVLAGRHGHGSRLIAERSIPMSTYLLLLGAYLADGSIVNQPRSGDYGIEITKIKEPHRTELRQALQAEGLMYQDLGPKVRILSKQLMEHFKQFGKSYEKFIPEEVFDLSREQLEVLFRWLMWGDGHRKGARPVCCTTTSKRLADDVQRLCLHIGLAANIKYKEGGWGYLKGKRYLFKGRYDVRIVTTKLEPQVNHGHSKKQKVQREYWIEDYQEPVFCITVPSHVLYVRRNGKAVWSGNSGRHGNKGIVTLVVPDKDMPHTKEGQHIEVALNPSGIPGRMNVGQVLETAAGKIARKTGQPYIVDNFGQVADQLDKVKKELKQHGLTDTEELIDPSTGMSLGKALVGPQHLLKLTHQVDKKISARGGMDIPGAPPELYDLNLMPSGGSKTGAQSMGNLGMYVMLAHGAKANIREMQTWKSEGPDPAPDGKQWASQHSDVWNAIQNGDPLPTPTPTFAFQKFTDMLRAAGINVEKKGNRMQLTPLTDKQVLAMSNGALPDATGLTHAQIDENGDPKPIKGGLFDPKITGGHSGKKWSHFKLSEPMPNPVFEGAIQKLLGFTEKKYTQLVESDEAIDPKTGAFVPVGTKGSLTGGPAISHLLKGIDVSKELSKAEEELTKMKLPANFAVGGGTSKLDKALKRVKYLRALDSAGITAEDAYTLKNVPVIPPAMRPASVLPDGGIRWADLNGLYKDVAAINSQMAKPDYQQYLSDEDKKEQRKGMYDGLKALMGVGMTYESREDPEKNKGLLLQVSGKFPKAGYFQKTLLSRRQDLTMRSTIVPEPDMGLDEVGIPTEKALSLFRPFVVKKMVDIGVAKHALEAQDILGTKAAAGNKQVLKALDLVMEDRPVLMKRDPALHRHSVQAFNARRVLGRAIQIHPLVTGGYNADFDGDAMSVYVPITNDAVKEARGMFPSNNLFNEATGKVAHTPSLESALGLYKMSLMEGDGKRRMKDPGAVLQAVSAGKLGMNETVTVTGVGKTTAGRIMIASTLPEVMQKRALTDPNMILDKKGMPALYSQLAKEHRGDFPEAANKLKDLGFGMTYGAVKVPNPAAQGPDAIRAAEDPKKYIKFLPVPTHSLSLEDMTPDKDTRDKIVNQTQRRVDIINKNSSLSKDAKEQRVVEEWQKATTTMVAEHNKKAAVNPDNLYKMLAAGVKPSATQYQQIKLAPMLLEDTSGRIVPTPVTRSYSEGLDVAGYWTQMHGARKGSVKKVQEVEEPGHFSKQLINTSMNLQVNTADCGTTRGVALSVTSKDVYDRELAGDITIKGKTFPKGTVLTPDIVAQIRSADKNAHIPVRSALKCEHGQGLCQKCAGLAPTGKPYELGTNLGLLAAQSLGERSVQLSLKEFHTGGVAGAGGKTLGKFNRIKQLTELPKKIPNAASLAMRSGTIEKIEHDTLGSHITIAGERHFVPLDRAGRRLTDPVAGSSKINEYSWTGPKLGQKVQAGDMLSDPNRSFVNVHDLYHATKKMEHVQNHLTNELHSIYSPEGVRRQHVETVVKAMSNLTRVSDPGDAPGVLKGEFRPTSKLSALNKQLVQQGRRPVMHTPVLKGIDVMPLEVQEDWMAKMNHNRLRQTVIEGAATGGYSDLHGVNPIPGMVYGAEFGMTSKDKFKVPHLANVPEYGY